MKKIFSHIVNCTIIIICIFANFHLAKYTLNHEYIYGGIFKEKSLIYLIMFFSMLIGIDEGIDSSQTSGKLLISILSAVAEIEKEII